MQRKVQISLRVYNTYSQYISDGVFGFNVVLRTDVTVVAVAVTVSKHQNYLLQMSFRFACHYKNIGP